MAVDMGSDHPAELQRRLGVRSQRPFLMGNCCAYCVSGILLHDEHNCDCYAAARRLRSCQCTHWCEYLRCELSDPSRCYRLHASWRVKGNLLGELHTLSHRYAIGSFLFFM
ncbi:hypothetical protein B296_00054877, partial [Ensete ventricosum]